jgi:hypothetical protein
MRRDHPEAVRQFEDVFARLEDLAARPSMSRHLRKLEVPDKVFVYYRGENTKASNAHDRQEGNKYSIGLGELKESVRFTVRGEDFYTPYKRITLVPPPSLTKLTLNKDEPAYIYWRLQGGDQTPLRGLKQRFRNVQVSITGDVSNIQVPVGTDVELVGRADRVLRSGIRLGDPGSRRIHGSTTPGVDVVLDEDRQGFRTRFQHVTRPFEFEIQFNDQDNVKGSRHVVIEPVDDTPPQEVVNVELTKVLRKPRVQGGGKGGQTTSLAEGFLITPDALLPFKGTFQDNYSLTDMSWVYTVEEVEFELAGAAPTGKGPELVVGANARMRRAAEVISGLQPPPVGGAGWPRLAHWGSIQRLLIAELALMARAAPPPEEKKTPLQVFQVRLEEQAPREVPLAGLEERLTGPPPRQELFRRHSVQEEDGFDFRKNLPQLKVQDPAKEAQPHYRVHLFVSATDNNVEGPRGPSTVKNKVPVTLLVVSENELLAQILLEEEVLRERLEKAVERLKTGKTVLDEQISKLSAPRPTLSLVSIRADEVRKLVSDASSATREVTADYTRILDEMRVNRVEARRVDKVENNIVAPLREITDPNVGNFATTEGATGKLVEEVEIDLNRLKQAEDPKKGEDPKVLEAVEANRENLLKQAKESRDQTDRLIERMEAVLQSIGGELIEREIIALLVQIERDQRVTVERFRQERKRIEEDTLKFLEGPGK